MTGDETGDESDEEKGEDELDDHLEATMSSHSLAFLAYSYTRLPCADHKVGFEFLKPEDSTILYLFNQVHLVVDKSTGSKSQIFRETLGKARSFILKYRKSPKAKELLRQWFPKRLPGYVVTRW